MSSDALEEYGQLVAAAMDRPDVLQEAARARFSLATEAAHRAYRMDLDEATSDLEFAEHNLQSLTEAKRVTEQSGAWVAFGSRYVDEDSKPQVDLDYEIDEAENVVKAAKARLRSLDPNEYYRTEISVALDWALRAQRLGADNTELRQLIMEMRRELGE